MFVVVVFPYLSTLVETDKQGLGELNFSGKPI